MKYQTKHSEELLSYMRSIPGKHVTAGEICSCMKNNGSRIGTATVYRQLEKLVDDGLVNKYIIDEGSSACYEFVPEDSHVCEGKCFHLKCESCGKLIHLECEELNLLQEHIIGHHGFKIDPFRTVFYGICEECSGKEKDKCLS